MFRKLMYIKTDRSIYLIDEKRKTKKIYIYWEKASCVLIWWRSSTVDESFLEVFFLHIIPFIYLRTSVDLKYYLSETFQRKGIVIWRLVFFLPHHRHRCCRLHLSDCWYANCPVTDILYNKIEIAPIQFDLI